MSDPQTTTRVLDDDLDDGLYDDPLPPPRPRRRLVTPVTGALAAVILVAGGFVAGVQVQKGQQSGSGGARDGLASGFPGAAARAAAATGQQGQQGGQAASDVTVGTVADARGSVLYVTGSDGTTHRVRTTGTSKVSRTASASAKAVHPGDTVIVRGSVASDGTITATSVAATSSAVSATGLGALGGFGGAAGAAGGGPPAGFTPPGAG